MEFDIEMETNTKDLRRQRLKEFYHLTHVLFTKPERLIIYKILKDYNKRHDIERLIIGLNLILRTYTKLELLKYVRYFIWEGHVDEFDRLTKFHMRFRKRRTLPKDKTSSLLHVPEVSERMSVSTTSTGGPKIKDVRVFTLVKEAGENAIGFSIRGGSEHGLGIYISDIDQDSAAEKCGLEVGDKILEANNISLKGVSSSSAVTVLTGFNKVKLVIQRARKVPEWRLSREKTSWVDVHDRKLISGEFEECGITHHIRGLETDDPERRVSLKFGKTDRTLGFNVRGGREYGLGIYVSRVDKNGLADKNGVRVGDQIIDVNGVPFDNISHTNAVEVLKGKRHLILTLKDVGRFPAFKELYAEYTWSDTHIRSASSMTGIQDIHIEHTDRQKSQSVSNLFHKDRRISVLQSEIFLPSDALPSTSGEGRAGGGDDLDSLSDLEHWNTTAHAGQYVNDAYDSDNGHAVNTVVVHVEDVDNVEKEQSLVATENEINHLGASETEVKRFVDSYQSDDSMHEDGSYKLHMHTSKNVNNVYAKINKRGVDNEVEIDDSVIHDNLDVYESVPSHSNSGHYFTNSVDGSEHNVINELGERANTEEYSQFSLREKIYDSDASDGEVIKQASISGSLYSKVKDIGRPSSKGHASQTKLGSSMSNRESIPSLKSTEAVEGLDENRHSQQTLQVRAINGRHCNDDSDNSNDELHTHSRTLGFNKENDNGYESDTDQRKSSKGKGRKGSYSINDEGVDAGYLEGRLKQLENRQTTIGLQQLSSLSPTAQDGRDSVSSRKSTWKAFKSKIKGSLRLKPPRRRELNLPNEKDHTKGGDLTLRRGLHSIVPNTIDDYNMATFEEAASKILNAKDYEHVMKNVKMYHESHDLDRLVEMLLSVLDNSEKILLLRDVRGIIYPLDIVRFDNRVNQYEIEAYQTLSMKLHLPLNHKQLKRPRKTIITTEIENPSSIPDAAVSLESGEAEDGHFHIRPLDQYEKEEDVVSILRHQVGDNRGHSMTRTHSQGMDNEDIEQQFAYLDQHHSDFGMNLDNLSEYSSFGSGDHEKYSGSSVVHLSKNKPTIGIDLYETEESGQREVRIERIDPNGAAHDDNDIEEGMTLLAVDRHKVEGCSKEEVMALLQKCFADKQHVSMKLVLHKDQSTDL